MRFLGIGDNADLSSLYLRLAADGHDVKIHVASPLSADTMCGLIERVPSWEAELDWVRAAGLDGCILFENVGAGRGALQDRLRRDGFNVIGSSDYGARLENDRAYAQELLGQFGFRTAPVKSFTDAETARAYIEGRPARYVLKANGPDAVSYVGRQSDGEDVRHVLEADARYADTSFVLMDFVAGVEMGVGAYFNGERFLAPACLDWEHKRFFPGDLGELTGEMGTVVTYDRSKTFFNRTLAKIEPHLAAHGYCGYINLNTIVNEDGIWPLEFTCRFGYPGYAILDPLQRTSWADLFSAMIRQEPLQFDTESGFCVGIVVTTPPFPYSREHVAEPVGLPILFDGGLTDAERRHVHYGEVALKGDMLVTSGASGYTLVVTGTGETIAIARDAAAALADKVMVMNGRYRRDIGDKLIAGDFPRVTELGLLDPL
jgi:phosphoribosylamine---glycine ligase